MKYSPTDQIAPQRHSSKGRALGAPASGGRKGRAMDPPVAQELRSILHRQLGELARGKPWRRTGHGSMAATPVPRGRGVTMAGRDEPSRGLKFDAAARNGQDTGPVSPSVVLNPKKGVALADEPVAVRRGRGLPAHQGRRAPSHMTGGRNARKAY